MQSCRSHVPLLSPPAGDCTPAAAIRCSLRGADIVSACSPWSERVWASRWLVVCHSSVLEDLVRPVDGLVRMLSGYLLIELHTAPRAIRQLREAVFYLHGVSGEQLLDPRKADRIVFKDGGGRGGRYDVHRCQCTDQALRIVRRHLDAEGFGDGADFLHLEYSAGVAYVRLHIVDEMARAELGKTVFREGSLSRRERNSRFLTQQLQLSQVLELCGFFHEERPQVLNPRAEINRHHS